VEGLTDEQVEELKRSTPGTAALWEDVVHECQRCADQDRELPKFLEEFTRRYESAKASGGPAIII